MPTVPVPIFGPTYKNVDGVVLSDDSFNLMDGYIDEKGAINRRPGMSLLKELTTGSAQIDGLFWWEHRSELIAVSNGYASKISGYPSTLVSSYGYGAFALAKRPTFAVAMNGSGTPILCIASGGGIYYTDGSGSIAAVGDADAPTRVSHVAFLDGYLLANNTGTNKFYWSDNLDVTSWSALSFASATGDADVINALHVKDRELYLFGPKSIEVWENNGVTPFARIAGGFIQSGCSAPYSIIVTENGFFWLDDKRGFSAWDGRQVRRLSTPYDKELQEMSYVADCLGDRIDIAGKTFFVFSFPAADRTLVYNATTQMWSEWGKWDGVSAYNRWTGTAYAFCPAWGIHAVGSRTSDDIYELSTDYHSDAGTAIRMSRKTGHIDYGTSKNKRSNQFRIRVRRGESGATASTLMVRWRDNNRSVWSQEHSINLGAVGETDMIARLFRTGMFRTRQYELSATDAVPIVLASAEEDIEVLR